VTTAISDQHISLYGNLRNVIESEYELIKSLPKNGLSLFNGNSCHMEILYNRAHNEKIFYQWYTHKPKEHVPIIAYDVKAVSRGTSFTTLLKHDEFHCIAPVFGIHTVENILPAIYLADHLGFTKKEIISAVAE